MNNFTENKILNSDAEPQRTARFLQHGLITITANTKMTYVDATELRLTPELPYLSLYLLFYGAGSQTAQDLVFFRNQSEIFRLPILTGEATGTTDGLSFGVNGRYGSPSSSFLSNHMLFLEAGGASTVRPFVIYLRADSCKLFVKRSSASASSYYALGILQQFRNCSS